MRVLVEKAQKKDLEVPVLAAWRLMDFLCIQKRKKVPVAPVLILKLLKSGAGNEVRTRDPNHGKVMLYQLSYSRSPCRSIIRTFLPNASIFLNFF